MTPVAVRATLVVVTGCLVLLVLLGERVPDGSDAVLAAALAVAALGAALLVWRAEVSHGHDR